MSVRYLNSDGSHIKCGDPKKLKGNSLYSSINWEQGLDLSRRDDLISMIFNLIYIAQGGSIPWIEDLDLSCPSKNEIRIN